MRIFLVRHGQTTANISGVFYGSTDLSLSLQGIAQSQRVADYLSGVAFGQTRVSALQRSQQTARLIVPTTHDAHVDARLNELDFGEWEMRHFSDIEKESPASWQRWMNDWQNATPGGEAFPHFAAHVRAAVEMSQLQQREDTLIVAHQGALSLLLATWLGILVAAMWHFQFSHDAYTVVENRSGYWVLRVFNGRSVWQTEE
ncbi:histidine phosphatase family protein [Klebsiella aerogenes]|uniref:histidine phosphatase family protein n=1 Tax=Klebsiella aerogenes TaxID=548 RepID=UPI00063C247F|nr:histidine phosphatase family protein [Klebsiella aerogenes]EMB4081179.1 histidine phosphatase family protein [Klebsiella aerogenes]KLF52470.1 alpha-ribazole phosphatase [Klebsiella aerogenes]